MRVLGVLIAALAVAGTATAQVPAPGGDDQYTKPSIAVGGQVRPQYQWFDNEEWGAEIPDGNGYLLQRYMFHVDARVSRWLRLYGELKSGIEVGRAGVLALRTRINSTCIRRLSMSRSGLSPYVSGARSWRFDPSGSSPCARVQTSGRRSTPWVSSSCGAAGAWTASALST